MSKKLLEIVNFLHIQGKEDTSSGSDSDSDLENVSCSLDVDDVDFIDLTQGKYFQILKHGNFIFIKAHPAWLALSWLLLTCIPLSPFFHKMSQFKYLSTETLRIVFLNFLSQKAAPHPLQIENNHQEVHQNQALVPQ